MADCGCKITRGGALQCQDCFERSRALDRVLKMLTFFESMTSINGSAQRMLAQILLETGKPIDQITLAELETAGAELDRRYNGLSVPEPAA